jgi:Skp family chaperone for outer membrane proteins
MRPLRSLTLVFFLAATGAFFLGSRVATSQAVPPARVAFLDVASIFQRYKKAAGIQQQARAEIVQLERGVRQRLDKLNQDRTELEDLYLPGTSEYREKKKKVDMETMELKYDLEDKKQQILETAVRKMNEVYTEIRNEAGGYARRNGFHAVLMLNETDIEARTMEELQVLIASRPVVFRDKSLDITDAILEILNEE